MTPRRPAAADFGLALVRFPRPNPFVLLWRWRWELLLAGAAAPAAVRLSAEIGPLWTVYTALASLAAVVGVPPLRGALVRRAWCVVTPHRVRAGCKHAWVHSRSGRLPIVLRTSPTGEGERVLLWCRSGTSAADLEAAAPLLTAACWASAVRVEPHPTRAQLVTLVVVRRGDPDGQRDSPPATAA